MGSLLSYFSRRSTSGHGGPKHECAHCNSIRTNPRNLLKRHKQEKISMDPFRIEGDNNIVGNHIGGDLIIKPKGRKPKSSPARKIRRILRNQKNSNLLAFQLTNLYIVLITELSDPMVEPFLFTLRQGAWHVTEFIHQQAGKGIPRELTHRGLHAICQSNLVSFKTARDRWEKNDYVNEDQDDFKEYRLDCINKVATAWTHKEIIAIAFAINMNQEGIFVLEALEITGANIQDITEKSVLTIGEIYKYEITSCHKVWLFIKAVKRAVHHPKISHA
eukprot:40703_1